ncbi:MAG: HEPN domain-containing protein [Armatimonadota bacterium]|nr:HEPN domain-containing protein [Armatimonadota bacterium]
MNEVVREWVEKAEGDFLTARREMAAPDRPNYDAVCFHAQQCVEKLMKALLISKNVVPPKTHDLVRLSDLLQSAIEEWTWPLPDLRFLDRAAVQFRYPGESANMEDAEETLSIASVLRQRLITLLNPGPLFADS